MINRNGVEHTDENIFSDFAADGDWGDEIDGGRGDYADWVGVIREVLRPRLDTIEDIIPDAVIVDDEMRELIVLLLEMAKVQLNAPCNNRLLQLEQLQHRADMLRHYIETGDLSADDYSDSALTASIQYLSTLPDEQRVEQAEDMLQRLGTEVSHIYETIERDRGDGVFQDHTWVKKQFEVRGSAGVESVGAISNAMPTFFRMAQTLCKSTESDTRRSHAQAIMARLIDTRGGFDTMMQQRQLQSGRSGRRRSSSQSSGGGGDDLMI